MKIARRPRYGIEKVLDDIEHIFLNSWHFRGRMYLLWLGLSIEDRHSIRLEIRRCIRNELLGREWWEAISKDIIKVEGESVYVDTTSNIYKYLAHKVFSPKKFRDMLIMLRDVREELYDS